MNQPAKRRRSHHYDKQNRSSSKLLRTPNNSIHQKSNESTTRRDYNNRRHSKISISVKSPFLPSIQNRRPATKPLRRIETEQAVLDSNGQCNQFSWLFTLKENRTVESSIQRLEQLRYKHDQLRRQLSSIQTVMLKFSLGKSSSDRIKVSTDKLEGMGRKKKLI